MFQANQRESVHRLRPTRGGTSPAPAFPLGKEESNSFLLQAIVSRKGYAHRVPIPPPLRILDGFGDSLCVDRFENRLSGNLRLHPLVPRFYPHS
jgi:hypothetical protein